MGSSSAVGPLPAGSLPAAPPSAGSREAVSWPQGISHRATMSIGQLLDQLAAEFPQVTVSKLRFLENEGLITPERTQSGYRKYSAADAERLRFILTAQRDRFWPLRVIRARLDALDAGEEGNEVGLEAVALTPATRAGAQLTLADLAAQCGIGEAEAEEMVRAGLLHPDRSGRLPAADSTTIRLVQSLAPYGIELRHLRPLIHAVDLESELIERATSAWRHAPRDGAREDAQHRCADLAGTLSSLHSALLRRRVAREG